MELALPYINYGQTVRLTCPFCSVARRKSKSKDLSVTRKDDGAMTYFCHHCGVSGVQGEKKLSAVPSPTITQTPLAQPHLDYLKTRGISQATADRMKLFSAEKYFARLNKKTQAVGFPYYRGGALTAAKYRSIEDKDFIQHAGGAHHLFRIDHVDPARPLITVEGELDIQYAVGQLNGVPWVKAVRVDAVDDDLVGSGNLEFNRHEVATCAGSQKERRSAKPKFVHRGMGDY